VKNKKEKKSTGSAYHDMMARVERENAAKMHAESAAAAKNALTKKGRLTKEAKRLIGAKKQLEGLNAVEPAVDKALTLAAKALRSADKPLGPMDELRDKKRAAELEEADELLRRVKGMDRYYRVQKMRQLRKDMTPKGKTLMEVFSTEGSARSESAERRLRRSQDVLQSPMGKFRTMYLRLRSLTCSPSWQRGGLA
jgi:hypothetical protein